MSFSWLPGLSGCNYVEPAPLPFSISIRQQKILDALRSGECSQTDINKLFYGEALRLMKELRALEEKGLIKRRLEKNGYFKI